MKNNYQTLVKLVFVTYILLSVHKIHSQSITIKGRVLEINSGRKPISNVLIKSNGNSISTLSNTNGEFTLNFKDKIPGTLVFITAEKKGYEVVNEKALELFLPDASKDQKMNVEIIICKEGYLEQARSKYYKISNSYINTEYKKLQNKILAKKEAGWQNEIKALQEKMKMLRKQLKDQAENYIKTNSDDLSKKELKALELFEQGKLNESLKVSASINSEKGLKEELENQRLAKKLENIKKEQIKAKLAVEKARRNMKAEADVFILKYEYQKAEQKLKTLATIDSLNYKSVILYADFLNKQNKTKQAIIF